VRKEDVKLRNNTIVVSSLGLFAHYFSAGSIIDILMFNKIRFKDGRGVVKNKDLEILTLTLSEECLESFKQTNQLKELGDNITSANQIANLELALKEMKSSNFEWTEFLLQCTRESKGLQSLRFKINKEHFMGQEEGLNMLCKSIGSSKTLNRLDLELSLLSEGLDGFKETLESIGSVQKFSLDLQFCDKISDEGLNHVQNGLVSLISLQSLSLNFEKCRQISDEGLEHLKDGLRELTSLQHLSLDFNNCNKSQIED